jgi:5-methylcytosine-specific restriction endonuclease McrA
MVSCSATGRSRAPEGWGNVASTDTCASVDKNASVWCARNNNVRPLEADEPTRPTSSIMSNAASDTKAARGSGLRTSRSDRRDTPPREFPEAGCRLFSEVTLSRRRHFHHVSLPRLPRTSRRAKPIPSGHQKRAIKRATMRDCGRRCVYCAAALEFDFATLDHVHPLSRGGAHVPGNVVLACAKCNRLKGDLLPTDFFARFPWAGINFILYARTVHRALKRCARRAVSLAYARAA